MYVLVFFCFFGTFWYAVFDCSNIHVVCRSILKNVPRIYAIYVCTIVIHVHRQIHCSSRYSPCLALDEHVIYYVTATYMYAPQLSAEFNISQPLNSSENIEVCHHNYTCSMYVYY